MTHRCTMSTVADCPVCYPPPKALSAFDECVKKYKVGMRVRGIYSGTLGTVVKVVAAGPVIQFDGSECGPICMHPWLHVEPVEES